MESNQRKFLLLTMIEAQPYDVVSKTLGIDRTVLSQWWDELKLEREQLAKIRSIWKRKFPEVDGQKSEITYELFEKWYNEQPKECCYCGLTQNQLDNLINKKLINSKRLVTRGKTFEIERLMPDEKYVNINNLKLACYWCNNAKSDVFTHEEFIPIAAEIGKALRNRLKNG
jgi:5-methylcytosine-specific restriction endonuclease McrA